MTNPAGSRRAGLDIASGASRLAWIGLSVAANGGVYGRAGEFTAPLGGSRTRRKTGVRPPNGLGRDALERSREDPGTSAGR